MNESNGAWGSSTFVLGSSVGLVGEHMFGIVEADHPSTRDQLWRLIEQRATLDDVLDQLSSAGLRSLPSFAVAELTDTGVRAVARGAARFEVTFDGGRREGLDGSSVGTWLEGAFERGVEIAVWLADQATTLDGSSVDETEAHGSSGDESGATFFVLAGVVPARRIDRDLRVADGFAERARRSWNPRPNDDPTGSRPTDSTGTAGAASTPAAPAPAPAPAAAPAPQHEAAHRVTTPPADDGDARSERIISGVPKSTGGSVATKAPPSEEPPTVGADESPSSPVARPGAVPEPADRTTDPPIRSGSLGDHDGHTVDRSAVIAAAASVGTDRISALMCDLGHASPPHATHCRVCGAPISDRAPQLTDRVALAVLTFSDGTSVVADRTVLIGRDPRVESGVVGVLPHILRFETAADGLSRTHAEVRIEGWQLVLEDLKSTNGTKVTLPNQPEQRLDGGNSVVLVPGTVIEFDVDLTCVVEAIR